MACAISSMYERGPDSNGVEIIDDVALGHVRLSIVDLNGSPQPMRSPCGRYLLSFNGEIYNYRELKASLKHSWEFATTGDTEVLLAGLILQGEKFLESIEGMWAFALWDSQDNELFLSRDRLGKKPLYYSADHDQFCCASELPALNLLSGKKWIEDFDTTADYFRYGYALPGFTFYKGIHELPPACYLKWRPNTDLRIVRYWYPNITPYAGTYSQAQDELEHVLREAVGKRLIADVEVGTFLSGGIDSSLVTALAKEAYGDRLNSFTIGFSESSHDESQFAKNVSEFLGITNHCSIIDELNYDRFLGIMTRRVGQPFHDSSIIPTSMVSYLASQKVKVALSGDGADELFGGYQRYRARKILNFYLLAPVWMRKQLRSLVLRLPEPESHHSRSVLKKLHLFMNVVDRRESEEPYVAPCFFSRQTFSALFPGLEMKGHKFDRPWGESDLLSDIKNMMLSDTFVYLPQDIHAKVDRSSMQHSLEVRAPFMDRKVVELALSLPIDWVHGWRSDKKILRTTFYNQLPSEVWARRKQGFAVPISSWFRAELGGSLQKLLEGASSIVIDTKVAKSMLDDHRTGKRDFGYRLWLIYVYLLWRKECGFLQN
ncbi:asparagine synthase (glutamine-hydrolyzing) [Marinobacter sp. SS21]|uniref:asparagine synthase (glutamine-hydrolyzing) n=1 Tax=Marinobacter sp. SS21 TaxID=2979460 RepID=UPI003FA5A640